MIDTEEESAMTRIPADEIRPGDIIQYRGTPHRVRHVDRLAGWAWPVAFGEAGWAIALGQELVAVERAA